MESDTASKFRCTSRRVFTSDVHEVPGTFYFYVDNLKVLVDRSEVEYPGSEVKDNW